VKEYEIDLALPPHERWQFGEAKRVQRLIREAERELTQMYPSWALRLVEAFVAKLVRWCSDSECLQEIEGLAAYAGVSAKKLLLLNVSYDIASHSTMLPGTIGCTGALLRSDDGSPVIARNLDWSFPEAVIDETVIHRFVHSSAPGWSAVTVGFPGFVGAVSGLNCHGVAVTLNQAFHPSMPRMAQPMPWLVRDLLVRTSTFDEAVTLAQREPVMSSGFLFIAGPEEGQAALIESADNDDALHLLEDNDFIAHANHYTGEEPPDEREWGDSHAREDALQRALSGGMPAKRALGREPVLNGNTAHQLVISPAKKTIDIRCPSAAKPRWTTVRA